MEANLVVLLVLAAVMVGSLARFLSRKIEASLFLMAPPEMPSEERAARESGWFLRRPDGTVEPVDDPELFTEPGPGGKYARRPSC